MKIEGIYHLRNAVFRPVEIPIRRVIVVQCSIAPASTGEQWYRSTVLVHDPPDAIVQHILHVANKRVRVVIDIWATLNVWILLFPSAVPDAETAVSKVWRDYELLVVPVCILPNHDKVVAMLGRCDSPKLVLGISKSRYAIVVG